MGVFEVEIRVKNGQNHFLPKEEQGEDIVCKASVDTGAVQLCLPVQLIDRLKLIELDQVRIYTADGGEHEYRLMGIAEVEVQGRSSRVQIIELPRGPQHYLELFP